jgi:hypothetical protein
LNFNEPVSAKAGSFSNSLHPGTNNGCALDAVSLPMVASHYPDASRQNPVCRQASSNLSDTVA